MSNSSTTSSKRVVKRRKVSKACVNCRRRKIKCTGTQPCSNCLAYKCPCEFIEKPKQSPENTLIVHHGSNGSIKEKSVESDETISAPKTSVSSLLINTDIDNNTTTNSNNNNKNENGLKYSNFSQLPSRGQQMHAVYSMGAPVTPIDCSVNQHTDSTTNNRYSALRSSLGSPLFTQNDNNNKETSESSPTEGNDDTCIIMRRKRKYKKHPKPLDINEPLSKDNGLYDNDLEDQTEYKSLVHAINQLESISKPNDVMKQIIKETRGKLNNLIRNWKPVINFGKLKNFKDNKSIETKLMKNKYRNTIYLGRFASLNPVESYPNKNKSTISTTKTTTLESDTTSNDKTTNNSSKPNNSLPTQQSFLVQLPLVDELFGLYSPVDALSLRGVGSLVQRYATVKDKDAQARMKATVYILLRFFDMCCLHLNEGVVSIANPLENYIERKEGLSIETVASRSNKELVIMIINKFPQPFTEEMTFVSNQDLLKLVDQDLDMFRTLLKMYDLHRIGFEKMAMKFTHKNYHPTPETMKNKFDPLINFCELQDLLLTLCYSYYNATLYHLDEYNSLDYLELLLLFLDHQLWVDQDYGFEKVLVVALDCALKSGLNRWEYYVNIDETLAERRRVAWWRLYEHEKMLAVKRGFLSGINDDKVNCLLPEPMRRVGFVDHEDFMKRILTHEYDPKVFQDMSIGDLKFYGKCALAQILSDLYTNVMFNEKYTSIKNVALPQSIREEYLDEIYEYCELTKLRMAHVKEQTSRLFEYARTSRPDDNAVPGDKVFEANEYVMLYTLYCALNLKSCTSLSSRLMNQPKTEMTKMKLHQYHKEIHLIFSETTKLLLTMETSYEMWRTFQLYCFTFMTACFNSNDKYSFTTEDDIVGTLQLFNHVLVLSQSFNAFFMVDDSICQSQTLKEFGRAFSMTAILIRILLLDYMVKHNLDCNNLEEQLKKKLISTNEPLDIIQLVKVFLDHKSYAFNFVLSPVQESGFHLNVQQIMESTYGHSTNKPIPGGYYKSQVMLSDITNNDLTQQEQQQQQQQQGNVKGENITPSPGVYPSFVLHDSKGNKVSLRNSNSSLNNLHHHHHGHQHTRSRDGHSPSSLSSTSTTSSGLGSINVPHNSNNLHNNTVRNNNNNNSIQGNNNARLLGMSATNNYNKGIIQQNGNDVYMNNNNNNNTKIPSPPPLLVQSPMPTMSGGTSQNNNNINDNNNNNNNSNCNTGAPPINNAAYNFGTLEEFVNNTDLNDLYKSLWNDNFVDMI
ncbi:transcription factor Pdr1p [Monosporozyma unispora]|nr:hypothetical protein C6P44_005049 [Kazachstania unispora]